MTTTTESDCVQAINDLVTQIAKTHLNIDTLEIRKLDRLDFHNVAVWQIQEALFAAFDAGKTAQKAIQAQETQDASIDASPLGPHA